MLNRITSSNYYRFKLILHSLISFIVLITLTDCSTLTSIPEQEREQNWQQNKNSLSQLKNQNTWTLLARVGIVSAQGSSSSQLDWQNSNNTYKITLNNILTFGEIYITDPGNNKVKLEYQDKVYQADTPENLLYDLTKLKLPISQLQYWIIGLPSPNLGTAKIELNEYAFIKQLKQNNYTILYDDYNSNGGYILPGKIIVKSPGLHIKISVQSWYV